LVKQRDERIWAGMGPGHRIPIVPSTIAGLKTNGRRHRGYGRFG
jgi:hypothetical protein